MPTIEQSIAFEQTPGLVGLRKSIGNATRSLNGIVVALETLRHVDPIYPSDLMLSWHRSDDPADIEKTRAFAMRSAMVAVIDALDRYLRVCSRVRGLVSESLHDVLNGRRNPKLDRRPTVAERVRALADAVPDAVDENLLLAIELLAAWRNEFVHGERKHRVPQRKLGELRAGAEWFRTHRGEADIVSLVARYESTQAPTLADLVTLFSAVHRVVAEIDERLLLQFTGPRYALALMEYLLAQDSDPAGLLDRIFYHGGRSASGTIYATFLQIGGNHDSNRRANAPSLTRREFDGLLGIGRKRARDLFKDVLG